MRVIFKYLFWNFISKIINKLWEFKKVLIKYSNIIHLLEKAQSVILFNELR